MIFKYVRRRVQTLRLEETLESNVDCLLTKLHKKYGHRSLSKGDAIMKVDMKLLTFLQRIQEPKQVMEAWSLLGLVKGLATQISDRQRVQVVLVKIRAYLLAWNWMSKLHKNPKRLADRVILFLRQLQKGSLYGMVTGDYYSRIQHLYLQTIKWQLREGRLQQVIEMMSECIGVVEKQIKKLIDLMKLQDKKVYYVLQSKVETLLMIYQLEVTARAHMTQSDASELAHQLYHKYQDIIHSTPVAVKVEESIQWAIDANQANQYNSNIGMSSVTRTKLFSRASAVSSTMRPIGKSAASELSNCHLLQSSGHKLKDSLEFIGKIMDKQATIGKQIASNSRLPQNRLRSMSSLAQMPVLVQAHSGKQIRIRTKSQGHLRRSKSKTAKVIRTEPFRMVKQMQKQKQRQILRLDPLKNNKDRLSLTEGCWKKGELKQGIVLGGVF